MNKRLSNNLYKLFICGFIALFFALYLGLCTSALFSYSSDIVTTLARSVSDEFHFLDNIRIMFEELCNFRVKGFLYNCYSFGYGIVYWVLLFIATVPGFLLDNQKLIVFNGRLLSLCFSMGSFYLVYLLLKKKFGQNIKLFVLAFIPSLMSIQLFFFQTIIHPETMYIFFIISTIFFLDKDHGTFGKNLYRAVFFWTLALSTKILAIFSAPLWIVYLVYYRAPFFWWAKIAFAIMSLSSLVNVSLMFSLIRKRFFYWLMGMGSKASTGLDLIAIKKAFFVLHEGFFNFSILIVLIGLILFLNTQKKNQTVLFCKNFFLEANFLSLFCSYLIIFFCCGHSPTTYHYGLPLLYALPVLLYIILKEIDEFILKKTKILLIVPALCLVLKITPFSGSILSAFRPAFFSVPVTYDKQNPNKFAYELKLDMDIAFDIYKKNFLNKKKRLLVRGSKLFGLIWESVYLPPLYEILYTLEDKSLINADMLIFRVVRNTISQSSYFFSEEEVKKNSMINNFFDKLYDADRLIIFKRKKL